MFWYFCRLISYPTMQKKLSIILVSIFFLAACTSNEDPIIPENEQEEPEQVQEEPQNQIDPPVVETTSLNIIEFDTALVGGKIVSGGGAEITNRGFVVGTNPNPTLDNGVYDLGEGAEFFNERLQELEPGTTYYVRAYATNHGGTSYSDDLIFDTKSGVFMFAREFITNNVIHNPTDGIVYFTILDKNEELNGFEESVKVLAYNYNNQEVIAEREIPNLSPSPNSSVAIEVTLGEHNGRRELYVHDDSGKINILDALTLVEIDNFTPIGQGEEYLNSRIHKINDFLHFASSDSLYFYNRNQLNLIKSLAFNMPNGKITVYNNYLDDTIETAMFISSSSNVVRTFKFNQQGDFIDSDGFSRESAGGTSLIRTNDNSPVVLQGPDASYFYKSEHEDPIWGSLSSSNFIRDILVTVNGQNVFTITGSATLLKYDASDLPGIPTEITIQQGPEKIFQVGDQLMIIDYNENDNDFLYAYSDGMTEVHMYFEPIQQ